MSGRPTSKELRQHLSVLRTIGYTPPDGGICDFSVFYGEGEWHLIHIHFEFDKPVDCMAPGQGDHFGHATSPDLIHWVTQPPALTVRPGKWDGAHLWAPHIVRHEGCWHMCYTGVDEDLRQRIGVVVSDDLRTWEHPIDGPGIDAYEYPWSCPGPNHPIKDGKGYVNCRDPYLIEHEGRWLCYYTAGAMVDGETVAVIALASSDDLLTWQDEGCVLCRPLSDNEPLGNVSAESPCVFERDGLFYLVYNHGNGLRYSFSDDPHDFTKHPVKKLVEWMFNFDILDVDLGLFAFGPRTVYSNLRFGTVRFLDNHEMELYFD